MDKAGYRHVMNWHTARRAKLCSGMQRDEPREKQGGDEAGHRRARGCDPGWEEQSQAKSIHALLLGEGGQGQGFWVLAVLYFLVNVLVT